MGVGEVSVRHYMCLDYSSNLQTIFTCVYVHVSVFVCILFFHCGGSDGLCNRINEIIYIYIGLASPKSAG